MIFDYLFYIGYQKMIDDEKSMFHAIINGLALVIFCYAYFVFAALFLSYPLTSSLLATLHDPYYYYVNTFLCFLPFLGGLYLCNYYRKRWESVVVKYEKLSKTWHKKHNPQLISKAIKITGLTVMILFIVLVVIKTQ